MVVALARSPQPILVEADPNGLAIDHDDDALYVADSRGAVLRVAAGYARRLVKIDPCGVGSVNQLGGLAITPSGTLYLARIGHGVAGALFRIEPDGEVEQLMGIDPRFSRLGVAYDARAHVLYSTQYLKSEAGPHGGSIVVIDLASGAIEPFADDFGKPVGVALVGSAVVVTDARRRTVVALAGGSRTVLADGLGRPDSICACGPDSVLVTTYDQGPGQGALHRLWLDGRTRAIAHGTWEPRGVACDGDRAFVAWRRGGRILVFDL